MYPPEMITVAKLLRGAIIPIGTEKAMQDEIERLLLAAGIAHKREYQIGSGFIDFRTLTEGIGIECKVDGGPSLVLPQLMRYAECPDINGLILATTRRTHRWATDVLRDKPFGVVPIMGPVL